MHPILLLHGALGSLSQLDPLKSALVSAGRKVYSMNFSGHSGMPFNNDFGIETFSRDVIDFLDRHQLAKTDIFGYSMGGYVALWLASTHPDRVNKLITLGTKFDWDEASALKETRKLNPDKILEKVPAFARILESRHGADKWKELLNKTSEMMMGLGKKPLLTDDVLKKIQNPTLILLGDQDDMADLKFSQHVSHLLPSGDFRLLENTFHPIEKVDQDLLIKILTEA